MLIIGKCAVSSVSYCKYILVVALSLSEHILKFHSSHHHRLAVGLISIATRSIDDADDDKIRLAQFYAQLSKIIRNEPGFLKTTGEFKQYNSTAGQINYAGISLKGKYVGLGQTIDQAIADQIGLENVELDVDKRDDLAKILAAISWELWHE